MEEKRKFVCKFCKKCFPSGKSLGGHIRTHMTHHHHYDTTIADDTVIKFNDDQSNSIDSAKKKRKKRDLGSSENYGLRENPRKTTRFVHSSNPTTFVHHHNHNDNDKFCKECGKGFASLKALCGHMACHSENKEKQKLVIMDDDTHTSAPKSSKRIMRFMTLNNNKNLPTSSSLSEVDQQEQEEEEEVAMCLMMLSKDFSSSHKFGINNNGKNKIKNSVSHNAYELVEKQKKVKKDMKFKVSMDHGVLRNDDVLNQPKTEDSSKSKKSVLENLEYGKFDEISCKKEKKKKHGFTNDELMYKNRSYDSESYENESDDDEEEEEEKSTDSSSTDSDSYPSSSSSSPKPQISKKKKKMMKSKKGKEHECPICNKIFKSGQALGGHKRSHFVGGGFEDNNISTTVILKQHSSSPSPSPSPSSHGVPCLIDLNLPAPVDE